MSTVIEIPTSKKVWHADFTKYAEALKPWVYGWKGEQFIAHEAPEDLLRGYGNLLSIGYANGWIK